MHILKLASIECALLNHKNEKKMINRTNQVMAKAIQRGATLSRSKQFDLARKVLKDAGVCHFTIDRVLYEPHNLRSTD